MKTIKISEEDYQTLIEMSKEINEQPNHCQAAPRFWEPSSGKPVINFHDEGEIVRIYDYDVGESFSPEEYAEDSEELWNMFLDETNKAADLKYNDSLESEWIEYVKRDYDSCTVYTQDMEVQQEHNPSLFLSDVQGFVKSNSHHLGQKPHTYARTIWRMPKMENLVRIISEISANNE